MIYSCHKYIAVKLLICWICISYSTAWADTDLERVYKHALFANAAYNSSDYIKNVCRQYGYSLAQTGAVLGGKVRYFVAVNDAKQSTLISVRGTENIDNVLLDLDAKLIPNDHLPIKAHHGFSRATDPVYGKIVAKLDKNHTIITTGHS